MSKKENAFCSQNDLLFAKRIKMCRENAGIKQFELAKMADITPATLSAYELFTSDSIDSKGKKPSLHNAIELAKALNISLDWLCGLSDEVQVPNSQLITDLIDSKQQYGDADFFIDFLRPTEAVFKILKSYAESFNEQPIQPDEDHADHASEQPCGGDHPPVHGHAAAFFHFPDIRFCIQSSRRNGRSCHP